ncbi:MAG: 1-deoxy-D-xylulose-5-phosphate synthase [Alphaproteobacteria bacterium]|nr:1-deoxy-D-xylulose-5-phosphate synthase [Alphaproteobacteria bacterium]
MYDVLKTINSPADVKKLNNKDLEILAEDIREALFNRLTKVGGHFGPNFGIVEAEIAMHYVFNSPEDKFVFDVSHQSYPHKMLTGRKNGYIDDDCFSEDSGYTNPDESVHDWFNVGHTSTSISLATGLAKARDLRGGKENVVALIGDGSLTGGEALEGLDFVGSELKSNFIIIVNDNQQCIAEGHCGIYHHLEELRKTDGKSQNNFFKALGLDYVYEKNGNDILAMIKVLQKVKDIDHPIVVHINTQKGKGYKLAEENREAWHWCMPFDRKTGKWNFEFPSETYTSLTAEYIMNKAAKDKDFVVITPAMPMTAGLLPELREKLKDQYVDVGIAEEHAVAMASGVAKAGGKPLVVTAATFMQRTYDQISQDVCINNNPVTILLNYASLESLTDVTHLGIFAIAAFSNIPNLVVLAPSSKQEYLNMLDWSIEQKGHPVMILIPGNEVTNREADKDYDVLNKFKVEKNGEKVAILALGDFYQRGETLAFAIEKELGFTPTLINPRFASGVDEKLLNDLLKNHQMVITLEDGILDGGFGQKIAAFYGDKDIKVKNYGLKKEFYDRYNPKELLKQLGMTNEQIIADIEVNINF